jgi:integrase/recombinase XerD
VTKVLQRLHDELVRRHYATTTRESYLRILKAFHRHIGKRLDHVGPDDLRRYQVYLLEDRRLAVGTVVAQLAALRFFYLRVLKRRNMKEDLPYPKRPRRLPIILSPDEVQRLIACAQNLCKRPTKTVFPR